MKPDARIFVAGRQTLIGGAIVRALKRQGVTPLLGGPGQEPELTDARAVEAFFAKTKPEYVFLAAGRSGGIGANQRYPAQLMRDNLLVETHVIDSASRHEVTKLLYLASSCCYPKHCPQPMREASLMTGRLEPTSEPYAVAKLAGIALCQAYRSQYGLRGVVGIPADAFGPGDEFSAEDSHVIPGLIRRMHEAKVNGAQTVTIWGTGAPRREFIFADELADACLFVMRQYDEPTPINLGHNTPLSIGEAAALIKDVVDYPGTLSYDTSRPDGMPAKWLDSSRLSALGWRPQTSLRDALAATYDWFLQEMVGASSHGSILHAS